MCILTAAVDAHDDFGLVITHTRDEYFARRASELDVRDGILAAVDAATGGTWMGLNTQTGHVAALTNVRLPPVPGTKSRGELVLRALKGEGAAAVASDEYACYNLLHGSLRSDGGAAKLFLSVNAPSATSTDQVGTPFIGGKSNDHGSAWTVPMSDPDHACTWPKVAWLTAAVQGVLRGERLRDASGEVGFRRLLDELAPVLCARSLPEPYARRALHAGKAASPLPAQDEQRLQVAPFVAPFNLPGSSNGVIGSDDFLYGTVSQSVLVQSRSDGCVYYAYRECRPTMTEETERPDASTARGGASRRSSRKRVRSDGGVREVNWPWTWRRVKLSEPQPGDEAR